MAQLSLAPFSIQIAEILIVLVGLLVLAGVRLPAAAGWCAGAAGVGAGAAYIALYPSSGIDLWVFWHAGWNVWRCRDPYLAEPRLLNPPIALPLFALLELLPFATLNRLWTWLNVGGILALAPLATRVLREQGTGQQPLRPSDIAVGAGVIALSHATRAGLESGQISLFVTLVVLLALWAQARGLGILSGALLAVVAIKTATWLPLLLLWLRRCDWPAWAAMAGTGLVLALLSTPPWDLLDRCRECLHNLQVLSGPGGVNEESITNVGSVDMLSVQHVLYHVGLVHSTGRSVATLGILGVIAVWLAWNIGQEHWPRPAASSMVCLFAAVFLYHRQYDMVLLALPLIYVAGQARQTTGAGRFFYALSGAGMLVALNLPLPALERLRLQAVDGQLAPFLQAIVLPSGVWAILVALFSLGAAESRRRARRQLPHPPECALAASTRSA